MNTHVLVAKCWDRKHLLSTSNRAYKKYVLSFFERKIKQEGKDITSNLAIPKKAKATAHVIAKQSGIVAGLEEIALLKSKLALAIKTKDGKQVKKGQHILTLKGSTRTILLYERIILNVLQRMSGIATATHRMQQKTKSNCRVAATRKTLWGLLDKKAVAVGKGLTHRLNLQDGILIKDNHIAQVGIAKSLLRCAKTKHPFIEIEVQNTKQLDAVIETIKRYEHKNTSQFFSTISHRIKLKKPC